MSRKRYTPEEIVAQLRQVKVLTLQSASTSDGVKSIGISEQSHYRCRTRASLCRPDMTTTITNVHTERSVV